jgi:cell division protein FtsB
MNVGDISNRDIMQAITELGQKVSGLSERIENLETRVANLEKEIKQDIRKLDAKFSVLSDSVVETKADMKLLKQNQH